LPRRPFLFPSTASNSVGVFLLRLTGGWGSGGRVVETMAPAPAPSSPPEEEEDDEDDANEEAKDAEEEEEEEEEDDEDEDEAAAPAPPEFLLKNANSSAALKIVSSLVWPGAVAGFMAGMFWSRIAAPSWPVLQQCRHVQVELHMTPAW